MLVLALLLVPAMMVPSASAAQTNSWQIIPLTSNRTVSYTFEPSKTMNVTVYAPRNLTTGGVRSLALFSQKQGSELSRYSLGYFSSGVQPYTAHNVSINLRAFPQLIHGDTLLLQVRNPSEVVEGYAAVTVAVDIEALLKEQRDLFYALWAAQQNTIQQMRNEMANLIDTANRYIMMLAIALAFVIAYVTRDRWYNRKRIEEEEKSASDFEQFLIEYVSERYAPGDTKGSQ